MNTARRTVNSAHRGTHRQSLHVHSDLTDWQTAKRRESQGSAKPVSNGAPTEKVDPRLDAFIERLVDRLERDFERRPLRSDEELDRVERELDALEEPR